MPVYLLAYHGSELPKSKYAEPESMRAWKRWLDGLGNALEGSNNPVNASKTINPDGSVSDGGGANPVVGLSFITAPDLDAAIALAKTCPQLAAGGSIEVAELLDRHSTGIDDVDQQ
jgi:hypothetical protein